MRFPVIPSQLRLTRRPSRRGGAGSAREISVTSLYRVCRSGARMSQVPYVRMSGQWLAEYGFRDGCRIVITGEPGKIVLAIAEAESPPVVGQ
jgi:hypothetical protein